MRSVTRPSSGVGPPSDVDVYLAVGDENVPVGRAFFSNRSGRISTRFEYVTYYLRRPGAFALDPSLPLFAGRQSIASGLPYAFADCAPDRWGRNLISKRRQAEDIAAGRTRRQTSDIDFLLGVSDATRQGALRFAPADSGPTGPFLADDADVPKMIDLPRLLSAATKVVLDGDLSAIKELLDAGTGSLGGARPKASVRGEEGLYIAKFASPHDEWDVIAWEKTALDLAERAGVRVPKRRLERIAGTSVLILERFDRELGGGRVPYISAMSLLGARDGTSTEYDYIDIAEALAAEGARSVKDDLVEIWRRVACSVAFNNTDDHLRNHGFLRRDGGWVPSPVFDINPNPDTSAERQVAILGQFRRTEALDGLRGLAPYFGLADAQARSILDSVDRARRGWRECANSNGISSGGLALMEDAFEGLVL